MPWGPMLIVCLFIGVTTGVVSPMLHASDAMAASLAVVSLWVLAGGRAPRRTAAAGLVLCLGVVHGASARDRALAPSLVTWFDAATRGATRGSDPVLLDGVILADASPGEGGVRLFVRARAILEGARVTRVAGHVQLHVAGDLASGRVGEWRAGRAIRVPVTLRRPQIWLNPGGPSPQWQTLRRKFDLAGAVKSGALVTVTRGDPAHELAARVRARVRHLTSRAIAPFSSQSAAIVTAILIGDRAGLDDDVERRLQIAGTYHVVAISGGNVALLTTFLFLVLRGMLRSFRVVSLTTMACVAAFGFIAGGDASVTRAVIAACVYLGLGVCGLASPALRVLGVVGAIVVIVDPLTTIDVGAWLSFGATLGIILGGARLARVLSAPFAAWPGLPARAVRAAAALLAATIAAEVALLPVSAGVFFRVGVAGLGLNFVAIPAMAVVQFAGMALVVVGDSWASASRVLGWIAHMGAWALVDSSRAVDAAPWLSWRTPPSPLGWSVLYYAGAIGLVAESVWTWRRRLAGVTLFASAAVLACAPMVGGARPASGWLRLTMFDVGQGDGLLLQLPSGRSVGIDAGGAPGAFDIGERIVTPAVWAMGERRLTWALFTHPDLDHIGGMQAVALNLRPTEIWEGVPVLRNAERRGLVDATRGRGIAWRELQRGDVLRLDDVVIEVINPPRPDWERQRVRNDDSVALRVRFRDVEIWLTGDAGADVERGWIPPRDRAPIRVLKVAHHGSRTSSAEAFVRALAPQIALVSVGRGNTFGHPVREVLERLAQAGATVFRTDLDGATVLETDGHVAHVRTMTMRTWDVTAQRRAP